MRRRTLLLSMSAAAAGGLAVKAGQASAAERTVLSSTKNSTLPARPVTPYVPRTGRAPGGVRTVGRHDFSFARDGRALPTRVWYPVGHGPYPVVLFSHGLHSKPDDYAALLVSWALAGFVVAAPSYPHTSLGTSSFNAYDLVNQPEDASEVLTRIVERNTSGGGPLRGKLDTSRLAAAGHSGGGITTAGLFSAHRDERLSAGILIAGTDFLGTPFTGPAAAVLLVHGRADTSVKYSAARTVYEAVPWSRAMLSITEGGHQTTNADFAAVSGTTAAFLRWSFYGGAPALEEAAAQGSVATLDDELALTAGSIS
ncbi:alpha/beta hydrolase family protein [Paractinoplanes lichenicola]|uniref:Chlorophyllase n=1 Tax=Paractinoplanes lichenicola TaxID=2802976 RepID=A0ABS1VT57_9ACTN|nr:chlorophyllase [Actinoplanes lichenicola]MBL7257646.1 chlorophyllase [Actinoplanes lichenicola]